MTFIQESFSIKDLENLSGIKAHTIRIWEQRYHLLKPIRSETNIRNYPLSELRKLLNISILKNSNYKISKIAELSEEEINSAIAALPSNQSQYFQIKINALIVAMLELNKHKFNAVFKDCTESHSFYDTFLKVFIPLFEKIGLMWQSNVIQPANEYFISNLVRQKLYAAIDNESIDITAKVDELFVILLPLNEIHDMGALFINYQLIAKKKNVIYLGPNISIESLTILNEIEKEKLTYIMHWTVCPPDKEISHYLNQFEQILTPNDRLIIAGRKTGKIKNAQNMPTNFHFLNKMDELNKFL
ncbi:MerR family transcriptional regulator [Putridiphycobacter roseus]|uniref:MerR family transcriptional regulator n=1 Tax=Putridiphycobacter roseus TaxID=2219161 RepID=A0A2W1N706_9FLAO|nr:MerR family transcriptional regulator [Putridiphycobacter roseus]PZE18901.1 MerR family transcriptional regulator [Putridiphycobacter roseus]